MKKHFLTLITALLLLAGGLLVYGCEKEPPPPEVEPELQPTLELSVTPEGEIPYGDVATLEWKTTNAFRLFINDERQDNYKEGNKGTGKLFKDTTYTVKAQRVTLFAQKSVTIQVGDWTTSTFGLVSYYPWKYKALSVSSFEGKILDYWIPDPEPLSWVFYYHRDGKITQTIDPNRTEPWYLKNDSTLVVNGVARKLQVDQNEMVISYETRFNGEPAWFNMIFEHASDTPTDPI
ncbi:MAG: hypothetical protein PHS38_14820 [Bacteroidales bacterium]|nr:hypothetical protein [Bacteroidales bacterium]